MVSRSLRLAFSVLVLCGISSRAASLAAQPPVVVETPNAVERQRARELLADGIAARSNDRPKAALKAFAEADAILHTPTTSLELAKSQLSLGLLAEALTTLRAMEASSKRPNEPRALTAERSEASHLQSDLLLRVPVLTIQFSDSASSWRVPITIDGKPVEPTNVVDGLAVNPGVHEVVTERRGRRARRSVDLVEGEHRTLFIDLERTIRSRASAKNRQESPDQTDQQAASSREVASGVWALSGLAVGGLATGAGTGLLAWHQKAQLQNECAPQCKPSALRQVERLEQVAYASIGVGLASGIGAVIWYLASPTRLSGSDTLGQPLAFRLRVAIEPHLTSATWTGTF
jgi:hypothetical protein